MDSLRKFNEDIDNRDDHRQQSSINSTTNKIKHEPFDSSEQLAEAEKLRQKLGKIFAEDGDDNFFEHKNFKKSVPLLPKIIDNQSDYQDPWRSHTELQKTKHSFMGNV